MDLKSIENGADYHSATAYRRDQMSPHALRWEIQPDPFKTYSSEKAIPLPKPDPLPEVSLWRLLAASDRLSSSRRFDQKMLASIFSLSYGFTARRNYPGQTFFYRSAASAGALYPVEIYVYVDTVEDLEQGLYHYDIKTFSLKQIREGSYRNNIKEVIPTFTDTDISAVFFITTILFRSAWKYRSRAFRYVLLDAGHVLENLVLSLRLHNLAHKYTYDFNDTEIEVLLGIDPRYEICLATVGTLRMADKHHQRPESSHSLKPARLPESIISASRVSPQTDFYQEIEQIYRAGVSAVKNPAAPMASGSISSRVPQNWRPVERSVHVSQELDFVRSVFTRRSRRNYVARAMSSNIFMRLIELMGHDPSRDFDNQSRYAGLTKGLLTGAVQGLEPGFYILDAKGKRFGRILSGSLLEKMSTACLDQGWLKNAAVHFLFMTNFETTGIDHDGRGYRYVMLEAGRLGQRLYLGATALGIGCCGIGAYYDDEAHQILALNHQSALLYLVAAGPLKKIS